MGTLTDLQLELEQGMVRNGASRYMKMVESKDHITTQPGKALLFRTIKDVTLGIEAAQDAVKSGAAGRGRPAKYAPFLTAFKAEAMAYAVCHGVINSMTQPEVKVTQFCRNLGNMLEETYLYDQLNAGDKPLFHAMEKRAQKATTERTARAIMSKANSAAADNQAWTPDLDWDIENKLAFCMKLLEIFVETTGLARLEHRNKGKKTALYLVPTPAVMEWLDKQHGRCSLLAPMYQPMIVPPTPWSTPLDGGYLSLTQTLVKSHQKCSIDEYFSADMPRVYQAVNLIQATAWRINTPVLEVMMELARSKSPLGGLPTGEDVPVPPKPADIDTNEAARSEWKGLAARAYSANASLRSKVIALSSCLHIAETFAGYEAIYFPHNIDFRGRLYPIPNNLHPQGNDHSRSLLTFAEGVPLGETGAYWLAVHIANSYGFDKASLDDRVQWVFDNEAMILNSAMDPLDGQRGWALADKPFGFLAACFEWAGYKVEGDAYVSHLPVAQDGSCSGLQHLSALLLDDVGGRAVNLVPTDESSDIYTTIANKVTRALYEGWGSDVDIELAAKWIGRVDRKVVKQPCMTYAYSATLDGNKSQIIAALDKLSAGQESYVPGYDNYQAARFLAPLVRQCIEETVIAAADAMRWMQDAATELASKDLPCIWQSPLGLPVIMSNMETFGKRLNMMFGGKRVRLHVQVDKQTVSNRKQRFGVAPNFVHTMDSSHCMATTATGGDYGIVSFAMIHDSFGTHAGNIEVLNAILRDEFIDQYSYDNLGELKDMLEATLQEPLPDLPPVGDLAIDAVAQSDFFFS